MNNSILESRIHSLERQLKVQRWVTGGLLAAALAVVGIAATTSPDASELRAKRLVIVNDKGGNAIVLASEKDGGIATFFGGSGLVPVIVAASAESGGELLLKASTGQNLVLIGGDKAGGQVSVSANGKTRQLTGPVTN